MSALLDLIEEDSLLCSGGKFLCVATFAMHQIGGGSFLFLLLAMPGIEKDVLYTVDVAQVRVKEACHRYLGQGQGDFRLHAASAPLH